jgi:hypothetical protein
MVSDRGIVGKRQYGKFALGEDFWVFRGAFLGCVLGGMKVVVTCGMWLSGGLVL